MNKESKKRKPKSKLNMEKPLVIIRSFVCFICLFSFLWGCDKKAETPTKAKEVTKKIIVDKKEASKPIKPEKSEVSKSELKKETAKPKIGVAPDISKAEADVSSKKLVSAISMTTQKIETPGLNDFYDPEGKLDPFAPLLKERPQIVAVKEKKVKKRAPLTPLEKMDLSQLRLVGIIRAPSGNRALIQEASGKGYVVKKGTYIGTRSGRIGKILPDRIIVEEEVEDIYGKISVKKIEIKLRPPGEE